MEQVSLFGVAIASRANDQDEIIRLAETREPRLVRFATTWDVVALLFSRRYRRLMSQPVLLVPATPTIARVVGSLTASSAKPVQMFQFAVRILGYLADRNHRSYVLGPSIQSLQVVQANIRVTFPGLQLSGRSILQLSGADAVATAIQKSDPKIIFNGADSRSAFRWLREQAPMVSDQVIALHAPAVYRKMSGAGSPIRPWRILRVLPYGLFWIAFPVLRFVLRRRVSKSADRTR